MIFEVVALSRADGPTNMGLDRELLTRAESGSKGVRVYGWSEPWITLGAYQNPETDLLSTSKVPFIHRPTGGRAVLHGHDVTVAIARPLSELGGDERALRRVYRAIIQPILEALRESGVPAALGENTRFVSRTPRSADCFAHVGANDVVNEETGTKVCGCALKVNERAALLQASIPIGRPLVDPATVFRVPADTRWVELDAHAFSTLLTR